MLLDLIVSVLSKANPLQTHPSVWVVVLTMGVLGMLLIIWRLWRFTLLPAWYPREPKELPYWIPILGHAIAFFNDSHAFLTRGRKSLGNSREPFAVTLGGEKLYVLTSADDVAEAFKNTDSLEFDGFIADMLLSFGATSSGVGKMFHHPSRGGSGYPVGGMNSRSKSLAHLSEDLYKQQLLPGERLDKLAGRLIGSIDEALQWEKMPHLYYPQSFSREMNISLMKWCGDILIDAAITALFGPRIYQINPNIAQDFFDFNEDAWKLLFRYPRIAARKMYTAKKNLIDAFEIYFRLPKEERKDSAWLVQELEAEQRQIGIEDRDIATMGLMLLWVASSNTYKICFWIMIHIIHDPSLMASIRAETGPAITGNTVNPSFLLESCPRLDAMYHEVLRISNAAASIRHVASPTEIGGKLLGSGTKVLMPYLQLHCNEDVWGRNANQYDPERFLKNGKLSRNSSYRPFGGGTTYCPGRFMAKQEVFSFVALALHRFQIGLALPPSTFGFSSPPEQIPKFDNRTPCMGIMGTPKGASVIINIKEIIR